jgi:choline dehydrogenase
VTEESLHDSIACGPRQFRQLDRLACDRSELPVNHLAGTCRLGPTSDRSAVVDLELRVIGVERLRVADASVMPRPPSGNTHATCMMIGERAADFMIGRPPPPNIAGTSARTESIHR